jgi:hypothetical protein
MPLEDNSNDPAAAEKRFEYFAFISYKHEDTAWAKWLQRRLENYRLPSIVRREVPHLPKHIRPIFRDQTDIGAGPLLESLHTELADSRYLIILCSPGAAKSAWVDREAKHFVEMGRGDRIVPFIVEGEPNSPDSAKECYPPTLRQGGERTLLGINVSELGKEQAFVKVVARLLGLKFDQLWNRHRRRERRNHIVQAVLISVACVTAVVGGFLAWDYYVPKKRPTMPITSNAAAFHKALAR